MLRRFKMVWMVSFIMIIAFFPSLYSVLVPNDFNVIPSLGNNESIDFPAFFQQEVFLKIK